MKKVIIGLVMLIVYAGMIYGEEMTVEKLINRVKQNMNGIDDLRGTVEITNIVAGHEIRQTMQIFYKKPNKFKMVGLSTAGVSLLSAFYDGENTYYKSKILNCDNNIRRQKFDRGIDYFPFKISYELEISIIFEKISEGNNHILTKESGAIYKIEKDSEEKGRKDEIWIDYEKGLVTKYKINHNGEMLSEIKEIQKFGDSYFPIRLSNEKKALIYSIITEINWKDIKINKGIHDKELKIE